MWQIRGLKRQARKLLKQQYWRIIAVCFIMAVMTGIYAGTLSGLFSYDSAREIAEDVIMKSHPGQSNSEVVNDFLQQIGVQNQPDAGKQYGTEGVLAGIFNSVTQSGSLLFGILNAINQTLFHDRIMASVVIVIGILLVIAWWLFIENALVVGQCRFFLEGYTYPKTPIARILYLFRIRKFWNVDRVMFFRALYIFLWDFTLVGGWIKRYSYKMVPYILAENPLIGRKEAFAISRRMMYGNKWRAFLLDVTFLGWWCLDLLTLGILKIFFMNPYKTAAEAELYRVLRAQAVEQKIPYHELLNDAYLVKQPSLSETEETFEEYPVEYYPIPEAEKKQWIRVEYQRNYSIRSMILLFFTFSIVGWIWEVILHLVNGFGFVNRGVFHGPWLPIYGTGGLLVLILLKRVLHKPVLTFFLTVLICGTIEYFTSLGLELIWKTKWWDYSGYLFNLHGRICLEGLIVFGLGGCAFAYIFAPIVDDFYKKIPIKVQTLLCVLLITGFVADQAYTFIHPHTGKGITDYEASAAVTVEVNREL